MNYQKIIRNIAIVLVVLLLVGLGGWYFFLQNQLGGIRSFGASRGFDAEVPSLRSVFGNTVDNVIGGLGLATPEPEGEPGETPALPRLYQISPTPVAGYGFTSTTSATTLRYMERATGYIFEVDVTRNIPKRLTNTLTPRVHQAYFTQGNGVAAYAEEESGNVYAFTGNVGSTASTSEYLPFTQIPLGSDIRAFALSGDLLLSLIENERGSVLVQSKLNSSEPKPIISTGLVGWRVFRREDGSVTMLESPASTIAGSAYTVEKGVLVPLVRNVPGLTIMPDPESKALLAGSDNGALAIAVRIDDTTPFAALPIRTIADKCAWTYSQATTSGSVKRPIAFCAVPTSVTSTHFLDEWYKGLLHTTDSWWTIDASSSTAELLFSPEKQGYTLDVDMPVVSEGGEYIVFRNARDQSLWSLRIAE